MSRNKSATILVALTAIGALRAQELWETPAFTASPAALLKVAFPGTVPDGTNDVVLSEQHEYRIDTGGRRTTRRYRIYRILTAAGVSGWDSVQQRWEPWHEERPALRARVITPDGVIHELDPKTIVETPVSEGSETYSDARIVKAPLPAVTAGAVVEEEVISTDNAAVMQGRIARRYHFGMGVPVGHSVLKIDVPEGTPLHYAAHLLPELDMKRTEKDGRIRAVFTQGPMQPVEDTESYLPFEAERWPNLAFSTARSWDEIASAYNDIVERQIRGAALGAFLPNAEEKKLSRLELAQVLLKRLQTEVRYTGIEFGEASYIPRTPAEVASRKFGDCKDQAALLVAILRASGIPAEVALLDSGTNQDIDPDAPGWGLFDHAIVHVPGPPEMWADPTSAFSRFNELPRGDRNRWALLVNPSGKLTKTPELRSNENRLVETRLVYLAEKGKARITEVTAPTGAIEVDYRNDYDGADPKQTQKSLDRYAREAYLCEKPVKFQYSTPHDLSAPFTLRVEMNEASRAASGDDDAVVAVPYSWLTHRLPEVLRAEVSDKHPKRKADMALPEPYIEEWSYKVVPPPGFRPAPLPDSGTVNVGPGRLTKEIKASPDGTIEARFSFDTGKRVYSAAEVEETRTAVLRLHSEPMLLLRYERISQVLLKQGKVRDAFNELQRLVQLHPKEALHHSQLALAMLAAGVGEAARKEAEVAIRLEPRDAGAYRSLGWILEHDLVGRRFQRGCDLAGAEKAYRHALELDPEDVDTRVSLAIALESSPDGTRYASPEKLQQAIAEYRRLDGKLKGNLENNSLFAVLRAGQYGEVRKQAENKHGPQSNMLLLAAVAAQEGPAAAVAEAKKRISDDAARRTAIGSAGQQLVFARRYKEAAALIEASADGGDQAEAIRTRSRTIEKTELYENRVKRIEGPAKAVYQYLAEAYRTGGDNGSLMEFLSADSPQRSAESVLKTRLSMGALRIHMAKQYVSIDMLNDLTLSGLQQKLDGDEASVTRIRNETLSTNGVHRFTAYVVREEGRFKILDIDDVAALGSRALSALDRGDTTTAKRLLDWAREKEQLQGGEDPLAGVAFARFWTRGGDPGLEQTRYAAAALMARTGDALKAAELLERGRAAAASDRDRLNFELALCEAYETAKKYDQLAVLGKDLLRQYPRSDRALTLVLVTLSRLRQWDDAERILAERLKATPDDHAPLRLASTLAMYRSDFARSMEAAKKVVETGGADSNDLNTLAWSGLCGGHLTPEAVEAAQNAVKMDKAQSFGTLHTLAAIYAELGKVTEARELILQGMDAGGQLEPNSESWYVFGRIAEQYGLRDTAIADYQRVDKPERPEMSAGSSWGLAQKRLAGLSKLR